MKNKTLDVRSLTRLSLLLAILLVMKFAGLGTIHVGPLNASVLTLPVAVGAILMGPGAGAFLGAAFGICSFYDAISGASVMTGAFFQISPILTFLLCAGTRTLMGFCAGLVFKATSALDKKGSWSFFVCSLCAPFFNTLFFMGFIVLVFYGSDYVQNSVAAKGATNPLMWVILLVGVQGVIEFVTCGVLGGIITKAVSVAVNRGRSKASSPA